MKRIIAVLLASVAFAGLVVWGTTVKKNLPSLPVVHADAPQGCSLETVAGNWGLTLSGTILLPTGPIPAAAVVRATIDAQGNGTGTEARNVGGGFANETLTSSWTVDSDCTGTVTVNAYESGVLVRTSVLSLVFVDNMSEVLLVQQSLTVPGGATPPVVITADGKKLFPQSSKQPAVSGR